MSKQFKLGSRIKDRVTGVEGIAIAKIEYLNGCIQYSIKRGVQPDGKIPDAEWVDSQQIEQVDAGISIERTYTGGAAMEAPRL